MKHPMITLMVAAVILQLGYLLASCSPASSSTVDGVGTPSDQIALASMKAQKVRCPDGSMVKSLKLCPKAPPPPPPPTTKTCPDGSVILSTLTCPPPPPPPPPPVVCPDGSQLPPGSTCPVPPPPPVVCADGSTVPAGTSCPVPPPPPVTCPDGTTLPAGSTCPAPPPPPPVVVCADGSQLPAGSTCPIPSPTQPAALSVGGKARALTSCQSLYNPSDVIAVGTIYQVEGFAGYRTPDQFRLGVHPDPGTQDVVILTDGLAHRGDGYFAFWVPAICVEGVKVG
jgi:hypothetical protein